MPSPIDDIKARIDIVELIQSYIKIQKAGANFKANCPFHGEKTPSFFISPSRQIWHCFGCNLGGDIFKFVMQIDAMDFPEALRALAQKAGVVLRREDPAARSEKSRLYDLCEEASRIFEKNLMLAPAVKNYLKKRGVIEATVREFRLGFAPQSWDFLLRALAAKGFRKEEIEKAGLAVKSEDKSSWYDRFRSRIMFPITDANGHPLGFGGRIFDSGQAISKKDEAKYINTPATPIYDKSSVLYGFDRAKQDIRSKNQVVLVEGYMDCIMSHQAGVKNTVAVSGTALTPQQLKILRRLCDAMICSFDTDAAGETATKRSLALAAQFEFERKITAIPSGKDPADAVLENPESWLRAVAEAKPLVDFYFEKTFREKNPNQISGKKEISSVLLPLIRELTNEIEKSHWIKELASRLGVQEESIWRELKRGKENSANYSNALPSNGAGAILEPTRRELLEERMLILMPLVTAEIREKELADHNLIFKSDLREKLFELLRADLPRDDLPEDVKKQLEMLKFKGELLANALTDINRDFTDCKKELEKMSIKEQLARLEDEIKKTEKPGDGGKIAELLADFSKLSGKLRNL